MTYCPSTAPFSKEKTKLKKPVLSALLGADQWGECEGPPMMENQWLDLNDREPKIAHISCQISFPPGANTINVNHNDTWTSTHFGEYSS